jgi:hypothetical protein
MKWLTLIALFAGSLVAATPTGPEVGTKAPGFELRDANGVTHTLSSLLGPKGAMLVFFRSADW